MVRDFATRVETWIGAYQRTRSHLAQTRPNLGLGTHSRNPFRDDARPGPGVLTCRLVRSLEGDQGLGRSRFLGRSWFVEGIKGGGKIFLHHLVMGPRLPRVITVLTCSTPLIALRCVEPTEVLRKWRSGAEYRAWLQLGLRRIGSWERRGGIGASRIRGPSSAPGDCPLTSARLLSLVEDLGGSGTGLGWRRPRCAAHGDGKSIEH